MASSPNNHEHPINHATAKGQTSPREVVEWDIG